MRVGAIGNSHLAAFKLGWEQIRQDHPEIELTFFGSTARSLDALRVEQGKLVPINDTVRQSLLWTSEGLDHIPGDLDAYILVGMGFSFPHLVWILNTHRPPRFFDPAAPDCHLISEACFQSAMEEHLRNSVAIKNLKRLQRITSAPIIYVPNPFVTKGVLADPDFSVWTNAELREHIFAFYSAALKTLKRKCVVAEQPVDTIEDRMFTRGDYTRGSIKLKAGLSSAHPQNDYAHMNAEFGARCLNVILADHLPRLLADRNASTSMDVSEQPKQAVLDG